jgi:Na+/H+ antiporter NhaD/arsenite permease-like protein
MNAFLWFLAVVFVSWLVILYVLPFLGKLFLRRLSKKFQDHVENSQRTEEKPEGSVHIENIPDNPDKKFEMGDYVNYEEIDEK